MGPAVNQRFVLEGLDPFRDVTDLAIFFSQMSDYFLRISCPGMFRPWTVTNFTAGILQVRCFFQADKPSWLSIARGVAGVALFDFLRGQVFHLLFNTLKRSAFFGIGHEVVIFLGMTLFAGQGANIDVSTILFASLCG